MKKKHITLLLLCAMSLNLLAACSTGQAPAATPAGRLQATQTATQLATATPAAQTTQRATLAATPAPATTPTATAANRATAAATATRTIVASAAATATAGDETVAAAMAKNSAPHTPAMSASGSAVKATTITLKGTAIGVDGGGVLVAGRKATITTAGIYSIRGSLTDGQIVVDTKDKQPVTLILNGITLNNSSSSAIYVKDAQSVEIVLAENSQNHISDGAPYVFANATDDEPNAAIFSTCDLAIYGNGTLTVAGNYNDGIASKDGLIIAGGAITVNAADDGMRGKDYVVLRDGRITIIAKGDGLKSDNTEDVTLGYVLIEKVTLNITSDGDAIDAGTDVLITSGTITIAAGGGSKVRLAADLSAKGIKGAASLVIDGGTHAIDSADDALHSNNAIVVNGGTFTLATGDDGMHADATLTINGGEVQIANSYEGIESAIITINGGAIGLKSSDDGINVAAGNDGSGANQMPAFGGRPGRGGGPGQDAFAGGNRFLYINGGRIVVDAAGDGIDANGAIVMTDGVVIVNGPTQQMNGALDHSGFTMTGGFLVAVGSSGMAQGPGTTSTQNSLLLNLSGTAAAGTLIHIQSSDGKDVLTFAPTKQVQSVAFSSPALVKGTTYDIYTGGSTTGTATNGLYSGGKYSGGSKYASFTVSGVVTTLGARMR